MDPWEAIIRILEILIPLIAVLLAARFSHLWTRSQSAEDFKRQRKAAIEDREALRAEFVEDRNREREMFVADRAEDRKVEVDRKQRQWERRIISEKCEPLVDAIEILHSATAELGSLLMVASNTGFPAPESDLFLIVRPEDGDQSAERSSGI
jgi:ABC-type transport system involved in cytochrome bd biosynthesis fused ATPase/permease subunit